MNLPEKYLNSMKDMLKDDFDDYLESFNDKRLYGLRVNNLKISTEDFLKISPFKLTPIPLRSFTMKKQINRQSTHIITPDFTIFRSLVQ